MNIPVARRRIRRFYEDGEVKELDDDLISEFRLTIELDGEPYIQAVVFPALLEEFVLGFLRTRGFIERLGDVASIRVEGELATIERAPHLRGELPKQGLLESTGSRNVDLTEAARQVRKMEDSVLRVSARAVMGRVKLLSDMPVYQMTGGTHCAILFSAEGETILAAEDVGRHNSVDKVIGGGLKRGVNFGSCWLAVSGRLPADMVYKPVLLGIPIVASVSAPTMDGVALAEATGLTLIGFTRGGRLNCYSHPQRIVK